MYRLTVTTTCHGMKVSHNQATVQRPKTPDRRRKDVPAAGRSSGHIARTFCPSADVAHPLEETVETDFPVEKSVIRVKRKPDKERLADNMVLGNETPEAGVG